MAEATTLTSVPQRDIAGWLGHGAIFVLGAILYVLCRYFPAELPSWLPWEFVWWEYLATALALYWFGRGLVRLPRAERPALWRSIAFVLGVVSIYIVLQT